MNATALSPKTAEVLAALRAHTEDRPVAPGTWGMIYLDNARPADMSDKSFRSHLAVLSKAGLYKVVDGWAWGQVKMAEG